LWTEQQEVVRLIPQGDPAWFAAQAQFIQVHQQQQQAIARLMATGALSLA